MTTTLNRHSDNIIEFETLDSTNRQCGRMNLDHLSEFTTVWAHIQTDGIGQRGNRWISEPGENLTFSVVLHPTFLPPAHQYELTKAMALGVSDWLSELFVQLQTDKIHIDDTAVKIKWPNDIYVSGRKICGILTENRINTSYETAVCGIGVNVNQIQFGTGAPNATSLAILTGRHYELRKLLTDLLKCLQTRYGQLRSKPGVATLDRDYLSRLLNLGESHRYLYRGKEVSAIITGVSQWGLLRLTSSTGEHLECGMKEIEYIWR